jgi:hypothetical protein
MILPHDKDRTYLEITSQEVVKDMLMWVGPLAPPIDKYKWHRVSTATHEFVDGVAGPIYLTELLGQTVQLYIMSAVDEAPVFNTLSTIARIGNLVTEEGDQLVDELGNNLVGYY